MTLFFAVLFYLAFAVLVAGVGYKIYDFARTPAPLSIPTTPAPTTTSGMAFRMAREVVLFESLFKGNLWIWLFGWLFHMGLFLVLVRHLRYFINDIPAWLLFIQPFGKYAGFMMVAGLGGLWARRFLVERIRYISTPSDHLWLAMLLVIGITGLSMTFLMHTDIVAVKAFFLGLMVFDIQLLPAHPGLFIHLLLVALLMILFPFSKLLHAPGIFFSPTRNQVDNPRETRRLAPWAAQIEKN
ncbi:MAG: respiratory nitrate reductase subunit gamma [Rhodocyclaceae bacterium]|nr:respiratory nitrate reductase subunit gamma [Rhodocyclaceae bacterium]MDZ4215655.1 respiratory nitrate reductase subunit gamma [Rhodocyclaceae bacterium]